MLFTGVEVYLFRSGLAATLASAMMSVDWLLIFGAFMVASWLATHAAHTAESRPAQYAALGGFVLAQAIIMVPMLYMAEQYAPGAIRSAATVTLAGFTGLTMVAFTTRKDFSFMGGMLRWGGVAVTVRIDCDDALVRPAPVYGPGLKRTGFLDSAALPGRKVFFSMVLA